MMKSNIEWTDATWNPWIGCTRISPGCDHCYAGREEDGRFLHLGRCLTEAEQAGRTRRQAAAKRVGKPYFFRGPIYQGDDVLKTPCRWRKPRHVFVGSRCDIFHEQIDFATLHKLWATMAGCPRHTFQILTKRPQRMKEFLYAESPYKWNRQPWYLPNVWLGVTAEDQTRADERVPILLQCPAAVRYVSHEPAIGPVDWDGPGGDDLHALGCGGECDCAAKINWLITGGESGKDARPMHPDWARLDRDQCEEAGVEFFFKQWGEYVPYEDAAQPPLMNSQHGEEIDRHCLPDFGLDGFHGPWWLDAEYQVYKRVGKKRAGRLLDGTIHDAMPKGVTNA